MIRILILIILIPISSFSQEVEDKKSRYPLFELSKGDDNTKNFNWGNFHFSNESYRKAAARFSKVKNPSVDIKRKTAKAYMEIDSVDKAMTILEQIIDEDRNVEAEDFLNLSQLQDKSGMYTEANKNRKKYSRQKAREVRVSLFETDEDYYQNLPFYLKFYQLCFLEYTLR